MSCTLTSPTRDWSTSALIFLDPNLESKTVILSPDAVSFISLLGEYDLKWSTLSRVFVGSPGGLQEEVTWKDQKKGSVSICVGLDTLYHQIPEAF